MGWLEATFFPFYPNSLINVTSEVTRFHALLRRAFDDCAALWNHE